MELSVFSAGHAQIYPRNRADMQQPQMAVMRKHAVKLCREKDCKNEQTTMGFCRLHYLKNWKKVREKQRKKATQSLNKYVEYMMKKHPDDFIENIKGDLRHAGRFQKKAEQFFGEDDFHDIMDEVEIGEAVDQILDNMKVDESY